MRVTSLTASPARASAARSRATPARTRLSAAVPMTSAPGERAVAETARRVSASLALGTLCLICQEAMESEATMLPLVCGHFFHSKCIKMLRAKAKEEGVRPMCPTCRLELHVSRGIG